MDEARDEPKAKPSWQPLRVPCEVLTCCADLEAAFALPQGSVKW